MDKFWRWFNPPLPDVMQAEMLRKVWYTPRPLISRRRLAAAIERFRQRAKVVCERSP